MVENTISYTALNGQEAVGLKAEVIPKILDVWLRALHDGVLTEKQKKVAEQCRILLGASSGIGFTAMIDEVTGFQSLKILLQIFQDVRKCWCNLIARPMQYMFEIPHHTFKV